MNVDQFEAVKNNSGIECSVGKFKESPLDNLKLKKIWCSCFRHPSSPSQQLLHLLGLEVEGGKKGKKTFL